MRILFVCLGNICRSPMAEMLARDIIAKNSWEEKYQVDSCAISSYEVGNPPHMGTVSILKEKNIPLVFHKARQMTLEDYEKYDLILGMDNKNVTKLKKDAPEKYRQKVHLFLENQEVPDPYYTGNFLETYTLLSKGMKKWLV